MGFFDFFKRKSTPNSDTLFHRAYNDWMKVKDKVTDPYSQNIWVYSAIKAIATNIAGVPFKLRDKKTKQIIDDPNNPFVKLFNDPHPLLDRSQLWRATVINYEKCGTCFWLLLNKYGEFLSSEKDIPVAIIPIGPDRIEPRYLDDAKTKFTGWSYLKDYKSNDKVSLEFYQVVRFFEYNPASLVMGFSSLIPADVSIDIDFKAHAFNQKFFENGTDVGGVLTYNGEGLSDEEVQAVRDRWDDRYAGFQKKGRTAVLTNGFEYQPIGTTHKDMDYAELLKMSREEIIATLNVPKHQVSLYEDVNYSTAKVADLAFWQNNLIPKMNYFACALNKHMFQFSNIECFFDLTGVEALKESMSEKVTTAEGLKRLGYSINEINLKLNLGMEVIDEPWANESTNTDDVDNINNINSIKSPACRLDDESKNECISRKVPEILKENPDMSRDQAVAIASNLCSSACSDKEKSTSDVVYSTVKSLLSEFSFDPSELSLKDQLTLSIAGNQNVINTLIKNYESEVIEPVLPAFTKRMNGYFLKLQKEQLKRFDATQKTVTKEMSIEEVEGLLFEGKKWNEIVKTTSLPYHKEAFERSIQRVENEIGGFNLFDQNHESTAKALAQVNNKIKGINDTVRKQIKDTLIEGIKAGDSTFKLRDRIKHEFKNALGRVNTIVRTETGIAANRARALVMEKEDLLKKWSSSNDQFVRDNHVEYNAKAPQKMKHEYAPGLKYPQDIACDDAGEVVNCRCLLLAVKKN